METLAFQTIAVRPAMGQAAPSVVPEPPDPDMTFTGFTGLPGAIETFLFLAATGAGAWAGVRTGIKERDPYMKAVGWAGGVGSALVGLLYLGAKSGIGPEIGLPAVKVSPY